MARTFDVGKVGSMVWPEAAAVTGLIGAHVLARGVDASVGWNRPMRRLSDYLHIFALGGAAYMVATDRATQPMTAVFWADSGIVGTIAGDLFYERLVAPRIRGRVKEKRLSPAEETKLLLAGRERSAVSAGVGASVGASSLDF